MTHQTVILAVRVGKQAGNVPEAIYRTPLKKKGKSISINVRDWHLCETMALSQGKDFTRIDDAVEWMKKEPRQVELESQRLDGRGPVPLTDERDVSRAEASCRQRKVGHSTQGHSVAEEGITKPRQSRRDFLIQLGAGAYGQVFRCKLLSMGGEVCPSQDSSQ